MDWWHKMRRVWLSVSARVKPRKAGVRTSEPSPKFIYSKSRMHWVRPFESGTGGGGRDDANGLLKLRDDVQMCGYKDVQVMWNMLSKSPQEQKDATAAASSSNTRPFNSKCSKYRFTWRFFFWSDHTSNSSLIG